MPEQTYYIQPQTLAQPATMFQNTQDILNMTLAGGFLLIVIFLCVALFYLTLVLRDVSHITQQVKDTTDQVSRYVLKPVALISKLALNLKPIVEIIEQRFQKRREAKKKK